jgi:hypothetical protein
MKLNDLEVSQPQKNTKARRFLESQHRVNVNVDASKASELLRKVHKLKEEQFYSKSDFHLDPAYTKLAMLEQLLKETAETGVVEELAEADEMGGTGENLEQAQLILAVQDMIDDIMGMAEDLAGMQVQKMMPVIAKMKTAFGMDQAQTFETSVNATLSAALDAMKAAHDGMTDAVAVLQGQSPAMPAPDLGTDSIPTDDTADASAGLDAASGPAEEPLGRGLKDEAV